jgi:hypothetical protein
LKAGAHPLDPRGLILEAYRMEGLAVEEARAIFLDWALGLDAALDPRTAAVALLAHHDGPADHPMTALLREAASAPAAGGAGRRGGRRGR